MKVRKVLVYLKSGGVKEVFVYGLNYLKRKIYYKSETTFLYFENEMPMSTDEGFDITFKVFDSPAEIEKIDFERIKLFPYFEWLNNGSIVVVGFLIDRPVTFAWLHYNNYDIQGVCTINLSHDKCWLGPTFVDKSARGQGLNQKQIARLLFCLSDEIRYCLTSANSKNFASIASFEKLGFKRGFVITKHYGLLSRQKLESRFLKEECKEIFVTTQGLEI